MTFSPGRYSGLSVSTVTFKTFSAAGTEMFFEPSKSCSFFTNATLRKKLGSKRSSMGTSTVSESPAAGCSDQV